MKSPDRPKASWDVVVLLLSTAFRADPWRTAAAMIGYPLSGLAMPMIALGLKYATNSLLTGNSTGAMWGGAMIVAALCGLYIIEQTAWQLSIRLEDQIALALEQKTVQLSARIQGLEQFERPEFLDHLQALEEDGWRLGRAMYLLPIYIFQLVGAVFTIALVASIHPLLLVLPLFAIPSLLTERANERVQQSAEKEYLQDQRRSRHLYELALSAGPGKELRIFGQCQRLIDWHRSTWNQVHRTWLTAAWRGTLLRISGLLVFALGFVLALGLVAWLVIHGRRTAGDLVLALTLVSSVSASAMVFVDTVGYLQWSSRIAAHFLWLQNFPQCPVTTGDALFPPTRLEQGIRFENVSFSYPGSTHEVLKDLNLHFPAGRTVAIVGENGSGKTTLVKLLAGYYAPSAGKITVDGIDLGQLDLAQWRKRTTAAFQDAARLQLVVREAVGLGDRPNMEDGNIQAALERAGVGASPRWLPSGLATQLGPMWENGIDLSSGQWQKIALGRTLMRTTPLLLVLDEPGANLDPLAEYALFERQIAAVSQYRDSAGTITVLITHRFSTVRAADLILVLEKGRMQDMGTHSELLRRGGLYAQLYEVHASAYRATKQRQS